MLLSSSLNGHEETLKKLERMGFRVEVLCEERFFFERLYVVRAQSTM